MGAPLVSSLGAGRVRVRILDAGRDDLIEESELAGGLRDQPRRAAALAAGRRAARLRGFLGGGESLARPAALKEGPSVEVTDEGLAPDFGRRALDDGGREPGLVAVEVRGDELGDGRGRGREGGALFEL